MDTEVLDADVIVVGAGPTGLMLANELGLAGVSTLVLERAVERSGQSRALNLQPRTAEVLDLRGWLAPLRERALATLPSGHFAGMPLDYQGFGTPFPYQVGIPQARVEEFLEDRLAGYGIEVRRGHRLTAFTQDPSAVTVTATGPDGSYRLRARYLVGADGGRSPVRKLLGVGFPGRDGRISAAIADIRLDGPGLPEEWRLPFAGLSEDGEPYLIPLGDGIYRFLFGGPAQQTTDRDAPVTEDEVRTALGPAFGPLLREVRWSSRFTDASRQAERYLDGRVLLAGDAAHIHFPAGGQGLNLGMQDAFNLGWKLAAVVKGRLDAGLLATYHEERHPVGARVLQNTRAQGVLLLPDEDIHALRDILGEVLAVPEANRRLAGMISGLDIRYPMPGAPAHPLLGARLPGFALPDGRGLLVNFRAGAGLEALLAPWADRVDHARGEIAADAVLLRPDGHVCWAGSADGAGLAEALTRWFGPAAAA
ncbi:FAD-dependent monooxygenase [Streptomyces sp. NPDC052396]|uniref:FAD-dependent monooxygenase n=1 Tax=Streptomyces sp. NPDC052396 TaxID=3365689 RepID=UPI0037CFABBE